MTDRLEDYISTREAAVQIGIEYPTLMSRIRKGKIAAKKIGWNKVIHKDEVKRAKKEQDHATNKSLESPPR